MDKLDMYRQSIQKLLTEYANHQHSYGDVESYTIFDTKNDRYQVVSSGWHGDERIYGCSVHIDIKNDKIWVQYDGTEIGFADELIELGVPREDIVLGYHSPFLRQFDGFAVS
jgi:XisI protein